MSRKIVVGMILLGILLSAAGCGSNSEPIKATWVQVPAVFDFVSIPVSEVKNNKIIHFKLRMQGGDIAFMAYELGGKIYVRANVCPPCRSIGFSLQRDILVCDTCQTTFKAKTGDGIEGACVNFPKASVPYEITDGNIVMKVDALLTAYQNTFIPGWP